MAKTENGRLEQHEMIADILKQIMQDHPDQDDDLRFAYALLTYKDSRELIRSVTHQGNGLISGVYIKNTDFHTLEYMDFRNLKDRFHALYEFAKHIIDTGIEGNDSLGTPQYKTWAEEYLNRVDRRASETNYHGENRFRLNFGNDFIGPEKPTENVYIQHQHICKIWEYFWYDVTMDHVHEMITGEVSRTVAVIDTGVSDPTEIEIPNTDKASIQKAAAAIPPLEYKQISGFGVDVETDAGQAMAQLASYFLYNATRAAHTHECIEEAQGEIQNANLDIIVREDPTGWWEKTTTRVRLVEPKDMPMMRLVEKFSDLPELARLDSKAYENDLNIADHAIKVCGAYHSLLTAHKDALKNERERLLHSDRDDLPTEIATAGIPELIDQRVHSLDITARHMVQQSANFGSIAQVISANRSRLGRIAGMPATVQIPAMDAIRKFNLYQMRRMQMLGKKVDGSVKDQLGMNEDIRPAMIEDASPSTTRKALADLFDSIGRDLISFQEGLEGDDEKQKEIARKIKDDSIETALESDSSEFNPLL